jgi:hypothetical protein
MRYDFDEVDLAIVAIMTIVIVSTYMAGALSETIIMGGITAIAALVRGKSRNGNGGGGGSTAPQRKRPPEEEERGAS